MRTLMVATAMLSMTAAGVVDAGQRVVQRGPAMTARPMMTPTARANVRQMQTQTRAQASAHSSAHSRAVHVQPPMPGSGYHGPRPNPGMHHPGPGRWGQKMGGRWHGGIKAPGGWNSYRRPVRGFVLPSYWIAPSWYINDWQSYGLAQPPQGYNWSRYYDDAVLIDGRGSVYDTIGGVDWDRGAYDQGAYDQGGYDQGAHDDGAYGQDGYVEGAYDDGDYGDDRYDQDGYSQPGAPYAYPQGSAYPTRGNGLGGAAIGAVAGGVAGNVIAGRGNRLGGTLIGAGVGAAAGYAIDKAEDHRRPAPRYGAGYPPAYHGGYGAGGTTVTSNGGYYSSGQYYPGGSVTTITVASAPVVTTTVTEYVEDSVTYTAVPAKKKVWRKKVWRAKPKCICR